MATSSALLLSTYFVTLNGPVPIIPLLTHVPGLAAIAASWMGAW